jgi:diguanylate cyclase (GGDEF)-like protein
MRRRWLGGAVALSVVFQATLLLLPVGALQVEMLGLLAVTSWATRLYVRRARELSGSWRILGMVALGLWLVALGCNGVGLLVGASLGVRMAAMAAVGQTALGCAIVTLLMVPGLRISGGTAIRMALDGLAVGLSLASLAWAALFGLGPRVRADAPGAVALITLSASLLVLLSASLPIVLGRSRSGPTSLGSFAIGIAVMAGGALTAVFASLTGDPTPETVAGGALFLGTALIGRAALLPMPTFVRRPTWESPSTLAQALPSLVLLALAVIAAVHQAVVQELNVALTVMLFVLAVAVLTRQFLSLTMNARLATELTRQRAQLAYQAFHDPLTGLANRTLFAEQLAETLRPGQPPPAVLMLDLDGFKTVNDVRGHAAGDQLLIAVARRMRPAVRSADTVARMGGDEFAVLLPGVIEEAEAAGVAQAILDRVARPLVIGDSTVGLRVSIGVALGDSQSTADSLLRDADLALYRAKREGKNRYRIADHELAQRSRERTQLEDELRTAIERDEFEVRYEPIVELATGRVIGAEAVPHWRHPVRGLLGPAAYLDVAVTAGVLPALDRRVLSAACRDAEAWLVGVDALTVNVNVCAATLADATLVDDVADLLLECGLPPGTLELEIPEAALVSDLVVAGQAVRELAAVGVRIALDDFGTGYSSLTCLRALAFDSLKIAPTFVGAPVASPADEAVLSAIIDLARTLGVRPVVTGVAEPAQLERLREFGCRHAQGRLLGAAVSASEFLARLPEPATDSVA